VVGSAKVLGANGAPAVPGSSVALAVGAVWVPCANGALVVGALPVGLEIVFPRFPCVYGTRTLPVGLETVFPRFPCMYGAASVFECGDLNALVHFGSENTLGSQEPAKVPGVSGILVVETF
jgi:hypothetical protein